MAKQRTLVSVRLSVASVNNPALLYGSPCRVVRAWAINGTGGVAFVGLYNTPSPAFALGARSPDAQFQCGANVMASQEIDADFPLGMCVAVATTDDGTTATGVPVHVYAVIERE